MPATVQGDAFRGNPCGAEGSDGAFEVRHHGDENVDGNDYEGEGFKPVALADFAPAILQRHEADAADGCGVELCVVEPAVHIGVGGVVEGPLRAGGRAYANGNEVDRQDGGYYQEADDSARFGAAREFVHEDEAHEYDDPSDPLEDGGVAVDVE